MCEEYVFHDLYLTQEDKSQPLTDTDFLNRVRCVCPNCQNAGKKSSTKSCIKIRKIAIYLPNWGAGYKPAPQLGR